MADTVDTNLGDVWQLIASPDTTGTVSVNGSGSVLLSEQSVAPIESDDIGHRMTEDHPPLGFFLKTGQSLYARRILGSFKLIVTLD